jgi:hypothetical protein
VLVRGNPPLSSYVDIASLHQLRRSRLDEARAQLWTAGEEAESLVAAEADVSEERLLQVFACLFDSPS